jgi:ribonuclease HI
VHYEIVFDGGSRNNGSLGAEAYGSYRLSAGPRSEIKRLQFSPGTTNNGAEYQALIAALEDLRSRILRAGKKPEDFTVLIRGDSKIVINQVSGSWKCKHAGLKPLCDQAQLLVSKFKEVQLIWHRREQSVAILGH